MAKSRIATRLHPKGRYRRTHTPLVDCSQLKAVIVLVANQTHGESGISTTDSQNFAVPGRASFTTQIRDGFAAFNYILRVWCNVYNTHYSDVAINRAYDQPAGGGHYFTFVKDGRRVLYPWRQMECEPGAGRGPLGVMKDWRRPRAEGVAGII